MNALNNFYIKQPEPAKSAFLALKDIILKQDPNITNELKYGSTFLLSRQNVLLLVVS